MLGVTFDMATNNKKATEISVAGDSYRQTSIAASWFGAQRMDAAVNRVPHH